MFSLSMKERRARGQGTAMSSKMSGQNLTSGGLRFQNPLCASSTHIPPARPCSRRGMKSAHDFSSHHHEDGGRGEGHHTLHSLPKLNNVYGKNLRSKQAQKSNSNEHCQPLKLPEVKHTPKLKKSATSTEIAEKKKQRSKSMKQKVLGSSEANVLPNRPSVPNNQTCRKCGNISSDSEDVNRIKPWNNRPLSPSRRAPPVQSHSFGGSTELKAKATPGIPSTRPRPKSAEKLPLGQVSLRPSIDKEVLGQIQSTYRQPLLEKDELEASRTAKDGSTIKTVYSQMKRRINPDVIPHGGPMVMESRSVNRIILKPEVPPGLQVVRRKSKFMQNQSLQDVYSIPERANWYNSNSPMNQHGQGRFYGNYGYNLNPPSNSVKKQGTRWDQHHDTLHGAGGGGGRLPRRR